MKRMVQLTVLLVALAFVASSASAVTLWDQSDIDPFGAGYWNSESGLPPFGITAYTLGDVNVDNVWMVNEIVQYYSAIDQNWGLGIFQGKLNIIPKTGPLPGPGDDPVLGITVPMSATLAPHPNGFDQMTVVSASGLSIMLEPGEYWIGITPEAPGGFFGPEIQQSVIVQYGNDSATWDLGAPGWMVMNPGVDGSLVVNGEIAVPNGSASWGKVKATFGN